MKIIKNFFALFTFAFLLATCSESTTSSPSVDPDIPALKALIYTNAKGNFIASINSKPGVATNLYPKLLNLPEGVSATNYALKDSSSLPSGLIINPTKGIISGTFANANEINNHKSTIIAVLDDTSATSLEYIITFNVNALTLVYTNVKKDEISKVVAKAGVITNLSPKDIPTGAGVTALYAFKGNTTASTNGLKINTRTGLISGVFDRSFINNITVELTLTINRVNTVLEKAITFEIDPAETPFSARDDHQVVAYKDEMYLIGGHDGVKTNDVWKSTNGANWVEVTKDADFSARYDHQVVVFNNEMYLIAGSDGYNDKNDVWKSSDGANWVEVTKDADFSARWGHQVVTLNNKMYLLGGYSTDVKSSAWESSDGKTWTRLIGYDPFAPSTGSTRITYSHQVVVLNNTTMYLIPGRDVLNIVNDVYSSTDGKTWSSVTTTGVVFSARYSHQVVVLNRTMYLIGGSDETTALNDVYKSSNGTAWEELISNGKAPFSKRYDHQIVVLDGEMYLIGGNDGTNKLKDVWKSSNGKDWFLISK